MVAWLSTRALATALKNDTMAYVSHHLTLRTCLQTTNTRMSHTPNTHSRISRCGSDDQLTEQMDSQMDSLSMGIVFKLGGAGYDESLHAHSTYVDQLLSLRVLQVALTSTHCFESE